MASFRTITLSHDTAYDARRRMLRYLQTEPHGDTEYFVRLPDTSFSVSHDGTITFRTAGGAPALILRTAGDSALLHALVNALKSKFDFEPLRVSQPR